jgi:hypothetical protein
VGDAVGDGEVEGEADGEAEVEAEPERAADGELVAEDGAPPGEVGPACGLAVAAAPPGVDGNCEVRQVYSCRVVSRSRKAACGVAAATGSRPAGSTDPTTCKVPPRPPADGVADGVGEGTGDGELDPLLQAASATTAMAIRIARARTSTLPGRPRVVNITP